MKYNKNVFIHNLEYLVEHGLTPELTLIDKMSKKYHVRAEKTHCDLVVDQQEIRVRLIEDLFKHFKLFNIVKIESEIDFSYGVEFQSVLFGNELMITSIENEDVIKQAKVSIGKITPVMGVGIILSTIIFFSFAVWADAQPNVDWLYITLFCFAPTLNISGLAILFNSIQNKWAKKLHSVNLADKETAKALLKKVKLIRKAKYSFSNVSYNHKEGVSSVFHNALSKISRGIPVLYLGYLNLLNAKKEIENFPDLYMNQEANAFVFEVVELLQNNMVAI